MPTMSAPDHSEDRKIHPREPIELKVEYERLNAFFADYTKNISRGGTFIHTERPLPVGTQFVFQLFIPTVEKPLELRGVVMCVIEPGRASDADDAAGMAIRFVHASDEEKRQVERQVERLMVDSLGHTVYRKLMAHDRGSR